MRSVDEITRDLARVTDELLAVGDDDFARRHELLKLRDALRAEADGLEVDLDAHRPTEDILSELRSRRAQLESERERVTFTNMMSGPGGTGFSAGAVSGEMARLTLAAKAASQVAVVSARIAALEAILEERGLDSVTGDVATPTTRPVPATS